MYWRDVAKLDNLGMYIIKLCLDSCVEIFIDWDNNLIHKQYYELSIIPKKWRLQTEDYADMRLL